MDPLTVLLLLFTTWVNTLHYTLGAAVIALAFVYFTRDLPRVQRIFVPLVVGAAVSFIGTGILLPASNLPQLGYPLCLFALGSGCAAAYLAVTAQTHRNLGWVLLIVCSHLAAYAVMISTGFFPLIGASIFGFFLGSILSGAVFFCIATWCVLHWNPRWTPWWVSGDRQGRNAFLRRLRRKKNA